ncbi:MAG TPA: TIGR03668 family PPOX class F420-dependent oxidoreductase [Nitrososphaeraceae archaeon]|nr:TIGR03668 family PPOX class F420-dependent oxidoreductase [Nitrososphaeraceae archaeon]
MTNDRYLRTIVNEARVARLATVNPECKPYLVPIVFVFDNDRNCYFIPIDKKTKRSRPENLKRVKNIQQNPNVALLIDEYYEDWTKLYFIMIQGKGSILGGKKLEQNETSLLEKAQKLLCNKYPQYQKIGIGEYVIMIIPQKITSWKN